MQFEFATSRRIIFGLGSLSKLGALASSLGQRALFVTNLPEALTEPIITSLTRQDVRVVPFSITSEPTVEIIAHGVDFARQNSCDLVIALGGGSAIDTGKAISALITNQGDILDYLEVVGRGAPIINIPVPVIAIPTTAGTGAEVTRNAVIGVPEHHVKVSLRSPLLLPKIALVDPELCLGLPPEVTASTGLDALTQLIEPYVSVKANPLTDAICREGMEYVARSLVEAYETDGLQAREGMSLASLFGGLALANSGLGTVHGFASVIGGMYTAPHGAICALLLPAVMLANLKALESRMPESTVLYRYGEISHILSGYPEANAEAGVRWVQELCTRLKIPSLSQYGVLLSDFTEIVAKTVKASSTKANPIQLTEKELLGILEQTWA
jgi:alcohol dehydrogenase class IV